MADNFGSNEHHESIEQIGVCEDCGGKLFEIEDEYGCGVYCLTCDQQEPENDGQPSEYDEWQDYMGGDDWDHGQCDDYGCDYWD